MKLSLIIPVYNVEKYIEKCLNSCVRQDLPKDQYEIIVVDDGSPDKSIDIVNNFKEKYNNIKVLSQQNQGLSMARNNGLRLAQGEYVWFIDSDDWIEENCLQQIVDNLIDIDLLFLNYRIIKKDITTYNSSLSSYLSYKNIYNGKELLSKKNINDFPVQAPFTIYKRNILIENNINFYKGIYHEDFEFKPRVVYYAKRIKFHEPIVYNVLKDREGSITSNLKLKNGLDYLQVAKNLKTFSNDEVTEVPIQQSFSYLISIALNSVFHIYLNLENLDKKTLFKIIKDNRILFYEFWNSGKLKYRLEYLCLKTNFPLALKMLKNL